MLLLCCDVDESDFDIMATYQPSSVSYKKSGLPSENEIIDRKYLCFIDRSKKKKNQIKWLKKALTLEEWVRLFLFIIGLISSFNAGSGKVL